MISEGLDTCRQSASLNVLGMNENLRRLPLSRAWLCAMQEILIAVGQVRIWDVRPFAGQRTSEME